MAKRGFDCTVRTPRNYKDCEKNIMYVEQLGDVPLKNGVFPIKPNPDIINDVNKYMGDYVR
ncbi:MAG: hypothetical protein C4K58_06155 [Flavobacteriaceae bacterium]|nr:MAG: hypothetical protein C4K58_06155 [Flavobacteriaceae bacterium]